MVRLSPSSAGLDLTLLMVGAGGNVTVKGIVVLPFRVLMVIGPLVAPVGTVVLIWLELLLVTEAGVPLKSTLSNWLKPLPLIVTLSPQAPLLGLTLLALGARLN